MTYYAILNKDGKTFWDANYEKWMDKMYVYITYMDAAQDKDFHKLTSAAVVEVTCDIKPAKVWVKKQVGWVWSINNDYRGGKPVMLWIHNSLSDGTLRLCDTGWEVYE